MAGWLSHSAIVSKQMIVGSHGFNYFIAQGVSVVFPPHLLHGRSPGNIPCKSFKQEWGG